MTFVCVGSSASGSWNETNIIYGINFDHDTLHLRRFIDVFDFDPANPFTSDRPRVVHSGGTTRDRLTQTGILPGLVFNATLWLADADGLHAIRALAPDRAY